MLLELLLLHGKNLICKEAVVDCCLHPFWIESLALNDEFGCASRASLGRRCDLQWKKLRPLLAHHPIAEKRAPVREIHQAFGSIHISIGTIHKFKPEAAEAVRVPDTTRQGCVPGLELAEFQRVIGW